MFNYRNKIFFSFPYKKDVDSNKYKMNDKDIFFLQVHRMATDLRFEAQNPSDDHHLKENCSYLSSNRYLKSSLPLGLRRSVSLEDTSINKNFDFLEKSKTKTSSVQSLCFRLRVHQLLPEYNKNIEKLDNENEFDWWNTIDHLIPLIENIILYQKLTNHFEDDQNKQDKQFILFQKSKRNGRRNGICKEIDRLCYNQQIILFISITKQIQIKYNLISEGFKI
jgi:hypothetical protein